MQLIDTITVWQQGRGRQIMPFAGDLSRLPEDGAPTQTPPPKADYRLGPDSRRQPGVLAGKTFQFTFDRPKIFPGTTRTITVYVPARYRADKPTCVYVGLVSLGFGAPLVFDNLIHKKERCGMAAGHA